MPAIAVFPSKSSDVRDWRRLARQVEQLFGASMADSQKWLASLQSHIQAKTALCARHDESGVFLGGMWIVEGQDLLRIGWLAVFEGQRRRGAGRALVEAAVAEADGRAVEVVTFGSDHPMREAAAAAIDLYTRAGFERLQDVPPPGPDGTPRLALRLSASSYS